MSRQTWSSHAFMAALYSASGDSMRAECERVNLLGWLADASHRSAVQA